MSSSSARRRQPCAQQLRRGQNEQVTIRLSERRPSASANPARFHAEDGSGYRFLADQILAVDAFNPMTAARLIEPLGGWRRYAEPLAGKMKAELDRIAAHPGLSKNVYELAAKAIG